MPPPSARDHSRTALAVGGLVLSLFGILLSLGAVELGFRVYYRLYPSTAKGFFWEPNEHYGWGLTAGREAPFYNDQGEFHTHVVINSKGQHDVERSYEKPAGVFRVLVLGDSYMESLQVELEQAFVRLLEADLMATSPTKIEVINTGVSSYGTDNELLFFRNEGYKYHPDLVLLSFTTGNDVRESYEPFNREALGANLNKPTFSLDANGALKMKPGPPPAPPVPAWRKLYVGEYLYRRLGPVPAWTAGNPFGIPPPPDGSIPYVAPDMFVYAPKYRPEVEEAWRVDKALLAQLRDEVTATGALFAVMVHNSPWVHYDERWQYMFMRHPMAMKTWDRRKPNRIIDAFLTEQGIPFIDLFDTFEAEKGRAPLFFKIDPHWTPAGHQLAAKTAAEFLRGRNLVPQRGD